MNTRVEADLDAMTDAQMRAFLSDSIDTMVAVGEIDPEEASAMIDWLGAP